MAEADWQARVEALEARVEISHLLYGYARACDRADEALMRSCFWPDSTHRHGKFEGLSSDFVNYAFTIISRMNFAAHHISNPTIEVRGDKAFSECYFIAHHRRVAEDGGEADDFYEGRYLDFHERRNGVWKIVRRYGTSDFVSAAVPANIPYAQWTAGHSDRAPSDQYYAMRQEFLRAN
ncbi:MAG: nuclear transport factor 2 family protein [Hyphomonadaceae bacterium]